MNTNKFLTESDVAMADIEVSYFDGDNETWSILSELFYEYNGVHPHPKFDLLHWFKTKFYWIDNSWVHVDDIIKQ